MACVIRRAGDIIIVRATSFVRGAYMTEFASFISSVRSTYEFAKGVKAIVDDSKRAEELSKLIDRLLSVQELALTLQAEHHELIQSKDELAKRIMEFEQWEQEKQNYGLCKVALGRFVYVPNNTSNPIKELPWYCTNCWEDKKGSILQGNQGGLTTTWDCPRCKAHFSVGNGNNPQMVAP